MKNVRVFPKIVIAIGLVFALAGLVTMGSGIYINSFVGQQLASQNIVTPDDATIPGVQVDSIATALSMADIIQHHAAARSNGLSYAEMGRFAIESGDPFQAPATPMSGPKRQQRQPRAQQCSGHPVNSRRSRHLSSAYPPWRSASPIGAILLGLSFTLLGGVVAGLGYALLGLITPAVAEKFGLQPVMG